MDYAAQTILIVVAAAIVVASLTGGVFAVGCWAVKKLGRLAGEAKMADPFIRRVFEELKRANDQRAESLEIKREILRQLSILGEGGMTPEDVAELNAETDAVTHKLEGISHPE